MPSNTLQTDELIVSPYAIAVLETELFVFTPNPVIKVVSFQTNLFEFSPVPIGGNLPEYNPSLISAVKRVYQNMPFPEYVIGGKGGLEGNDYGLFKRSTSQALTVWRSKVYNIGKDFKVMKITFNLGRDLEEATSIVPKLYFDNQRSSSVGKTINAVNYSERFIILTAEDFDNKVHGRHNFFLEFQFRGATLSPIALPINIELDAYEY